MKIAALCCTYKRPRLLEHVIESFLRQDYPAEMRELIILDDAGQYDNIARDGWSLVSIKRRFKTLGEKRNASAALASPDVNVYCVWDDDDVYLPWHMSAAAQALEHGSYTMPSKLYIDRVDHLDIKDNTYMFHGAWSFRRTAFVAAHGYPFIQSGQDQGLLNRFKDLKLVETDPLLFDSRPSYVYRWFTEHKTHLSVKGGSYEARVNEPLVEIADLRPAWDRDWLALHEAAAVR